MNSDIDLKDKGDASMPKKKPIVVILVAVLLLAIPIFFLLRKQSTTAQPDVTPKMDIAALEQAVEKQPTYSNLVDLSVAYINQQNPGSALPLLKRALEMKPDGAVAYNNLGVAYIMQKNYQLAIEACKKAMQYDGALELASNNMKWALDEQRKVFEDINRMEAIAEDKRDAAYYIDLGLNYYRVGNYEKSIALCKKGLTIDEKNALLFNNLGSNLVMMKKYDEATSMFEKAMDLNPEDQIAKNNIIWAKLEQASESQPKN